MFCTFSEIRNAFLSHSDLILSSCIHGCNTSLVVGLWIMMEMNFWVICKNKNSSILQELLQLLAFEKTSQLTPKCVQLQLNKYTFSLSIKPKIFSWVTLVRGLQLSLAKHLWLPLSNRCLMAGATNTQPTKVRAFSQTSKYNPWYQTKL